MLRAEVHNSDKGLILTLEGRLAGDDAERVRMLVTPCEPERELVIDLSGVTFIDSAGESTMLFLGQLGARFIAEDVFVLGMCERLQLPLARNGERKEAARCRAVDHG